MTQRGIASMSVAVVVVLAVGIAAFSGAFGSDDQAPTEDPETVDLTGPAAGVEQVDATLIRPRYLQTRRMIAVSLTNHGTSPARFARFQLSAPLFATVPPTQRDTTLEPGARLDIPIDYGEAQCEAPEGETVVITGVRGADGHVRQARLPLPDPDPLLERLHTNECGQLAVKDAVDIAFGPSWERSGAGLRGTLLLRRRASAEPVTVVDVGGTVIFTIRTVPELPKPLVRLDPATESAEIPVEISASRCDPHALIESKKTFIFPIWVGLGDAPEQYLEIEPQGEGRRLLEQLQEECAAAAG